MESYCCIEGCLNPIFVKKDQLCRPHYTQMRRHGDPLAWKKPVRQICVVEDCELKQAAHGLCDKHYRRNKRYGTTDLPPKSIGCKVDGCDDPHQGLGYCDKHHDRYIKTGDPLKELYCVQCNQQIDTENTSRRRYCSDKCWEKAQYWDRKEKYRSVQLKQYGLTVEQYEQMVIDQDNKCKICGKSEPGGYGKHWHVDHDHENGVVRGLLCESCNTGLGKFKDSPELLEKALLYLKI